MKKEAYEVLIIGGGAAGLSAGLALGRMRRNVLLCDDGRPRNQNAEAMHNFLGRDGAPPADLRREARRDLEKYESVEIHDAKVHAIEKTKLGFAALFESGQTIQFKKVLLAHGISDQLPDLPGFRELWGKSVFHCPYCHGFEFRDQPLALFGDGELALHVAPLLLGLTDDLILFTHGSRLLTDAHREMFFHNGIRIEDRPVRKLQHTGFQLKAIELNDGTQILRDALVLLPTLPFKLKSNFAEALGCELTELGLIKTDEAGRTSVPGLYAAGDLARPAHSVLLAAARGQLAGANIVSEILSEKFHGRI